MEIITLTTIFLASLNAFNNDRGFVYNTEGSEDVVTAKVVYKKSEDGKYLSHHLKYNYTYDDQQRLDWMMQDNAIVMNLGNRLLSSFEREF